MTSVSQQDQFKVTLEDPRLSSAGHKHLRISHRYLGELDISFRRTVRVPDNGTTYQLPPDCGPLSIFSVKDYEKQLPDLMVTKGGMFIPMYSKCYSQSQAHSRSCTNLPAEREAMWINFKGCRPFAIKIYVGGINAVSGEPAVETSGTLQRRKQRLDQGKSIQDYVVPPTQIWLDGVATTDGKVMQFTATPAGSGYSIEAQLSGSDTIAGLQFEVFPIKFDPNRLFKVAVKTFLGKMLQFQVSLGTTVSGLKELIQKKEGTPLDQQHLVFKGNQLEEGQHSCCL